MTFPNAERAIVPARKITLICFQAIIETAIAVIT